MRSRHKASKKPSFWLHALLLCTYAIPSMVLAGAGLLLCLTIVGIVPGVFLIGLSGILVAYEVNRYGKKKDAWKLRQQGAHRFDTGRGKAGRVNVVLVEDLEYEYDPVLDDMVPREKPWNE
jgi:hypothetical protein